MGRTSGAPLITLGSKEGTGVSSSDSNNPHPAGEFAYGGPFFGTVFKITTGGSLTTLYRFNADDGANPYAGLVQGSDGHFYGTTVRGGISEFGTVFKISAAVAPTSKDQCTNGGWATFTSPRTFKNQGDCIQFVNTGK